MIVLVMPSAVTFALQILLVVLAGLNLFALFQHTRARRRLARAVRLGGAVFVDCRFESPER